VLFRIKKKLGPDYLEKIMQRDGGSSPFIISDLVDTGN
jgi:hypothetical protein